MQFSNTKEDGLETIIVDWLVKHNGYEQGTNADYNKEYAIDETRLFRFLADTQPDEMEKLAVFKSEQKKRTFLNRLQGELAKRGIIDVLRNGIKVYPADLIMFYLTPNENNDTAKALYAKNIFSVTRQLRYSIDAGKLALDLCIFINGLPVITFELKNQLTKQNVENAVQQYKDDRSPKEQIFSFKRCMVHFAVDDDRVKFCTKLAAQDSWFLPFDKGYNDGAGNPPNPNGLKTDYLWKEILTKDKLTRIIESYAQVVTEVDEETKKKTVKQIFPRYHQLDVVEKLIADVEANGVGNRYLIQHSAGSGKSNSIAWLAYRLMELEKDAHPIFNSILVVTDRRILDKQIRDNIKQFAQVGNVVAWAEHSGDLRKAITDGKRIIITTIEKFPYVVPDIGAEHKDNKFAILIDEAHSGQNGRNSAQMNLALSGLASDNDMDNEDKINAMMEGRKLLKNASYFAFTATPKNKTLETFGKKLTDEKGNPIYNEDGTQKALAFHVYTMKQAIQEAVERCYARHELKDDYFAVILDWKMPDMDGIETARQIRKRIGKEIPIIVLTSYEFSEIEEEAKAAGVDAFIAKPLFRSRLTATLRQFTSGRKEKIARNYLEKLSESDYTGKRILLVEDNELNREIAGEILQMTGAEVETAENGKIAVEKVEASPEGLYDLVFMDIQMPVMNGYEATAAIRSLPGEKGKLPIVAMTANAFAEDVQLAKNTGMNGHIAKPLDMNKLNDVLESWL